MQACPLNSILTVCAMNGLTFERADVISHFRSPMHNCRQCSIICSGQNFSGYITFYRISPDPPTKPSHWESLCLQNSLDFDEEVTGKVGKRFIGFKRYRTQYPRAKRQAQYRLALGEDVG